MIETEKITKRKKIIYISIASLILFAGILIYLQRKSQQEEAALYSRTYCDLNSKMIALHQEIRNLRNENSEINFMKDSLQNNMDYLWAYKTLVQSSRLRDDVGVNFKFKPGDIVHLKMDSSKVVITDLVIGGNVYNYYIRFLVKNNKGIGFEVSPLEIEPLN